MMVGGWRDEGECRWKEEKKYEGRLLVTGAPAKTRDDVKSENERKIEGAGTRVENEGRC